MSEANLVSSEQKRLRLQLFAATWLSYAGFYVTRKVFSVVKGPIKVALEADDLFVSHLFTTYLVTYMLGQFLAAWLSRKVASRTLLLLGMSISIGCNLAMGALLPLGRPAYPLLLLAMAVQGVAQATGWPCNVGLMANWTRRSERGTVMAVWGTCYQLGSVAAKALASFTFAWLGLLWSFWGSSAVLLGVVILFYFWGRERPEESGLAPLEEEEQPPPSQVPGAQPTAGEAARRQLRMAIAMGLIYFGFKFLRYALDSWTVLILGERFQLPLDQAGYLSTAFDWVGFLGVLAAGWISDRFFAAARAPVIFLMAAGSLLGTVLLWRVGLSSVAAFVLLLGLIGFMAMGPDSLLSGAGAMDTGSKRRAAMAAGIVNGLGSIGPIIQEPAIAAVKTYYGLEAVLLLLVVMTAVATVATGLLWSARRPKAAPVPAA